MHIIKRIAHNPIQLIFKMPAFDVLVGLSEKLLYYTLKLVLFDISETLFFCTDCGIYLYIYIPYVPFNFYYIFMLHWTEVIVFFQSLIFYWKTLFHIFLFHCYLQVMLIESYVPLFTIMARVSSVCHFIEWVVVLFIVLVMYE